MSYTTALSRLFSKFSTPSTMPSDIAKANIDDLVENLTTEEAILLSAGVGFWHTHEVKRLGIPAIKVCNSTNHKPQSKVYNYRSLMDQMVCLL